MLLSVSVWCQHPLTPEAQVAYIASIICLFVHLYFGGFLVPKWDLRLRAFRTVMRVCHPCLVSLPPVSLMISLLQNSMATQFIYSNMVLLIRVAIIMEWSESPIPLPIPLRVLPFTLTGTGGLGK